MAKKVSILGCGWLGLPLAKNLVDQGYDVKGSTTTTSKLKILSALRITPFKIVIGELQDNIVEFLNSEYLIVCITSKNTSAYRSLIAKIECSIVSKIIFISSTGIYLASSFPVTEESPVKVDSPLCEIEELFRENKKFVTTFLRLGGLIGPGRHPGNFFTSGKLLKDPENVVNLIHLDDCISIITHVLLNEVWNETLNCCSDSHPTKKEFYSAAAKILGLPTPKVDASASYNNKLISSERMKSGLGVELKNNDLMNILTQLL